MWFRRRRGEPPSRERLLEGVPMLNRNVRRGETSGRLRLTVPRNRTWLTRVLGLVFHIPREQVMELDAIGEEVLRLCDGRRTVKDIGRRLAQSRQLHEREAEAALLQYLRALVRRGVIGIAIPQRRKRKKRK